MGGIPGKEIGVVTTCAWGGEFKLIDDTDAWRFVDRLGMGGLIGIPGICGVMSNSPVVWAEKVITFFIKEIFYFYYSF